MGTRLWILLLCLFFMRLSTLFAETIKEMVWFHSQDAVGLVDQLLECEQGKLLSQALIHQHNYLVKKGYKLSIHVELQSSKNSETNFIYNEKEKELKVTITLKCNDEKRIETLDRPILVKEGNFYRLSCIKIPGFIILAHELLHALNHSELLLYGDTETITKYLDALKNSKISNRSDAIQYFLKEKLALLNNTIFLDTKYCKLWQNYENKDSLDEMTTILCSFHYIGKGKCARIGETLFLREYYGKNIISWTHYTAQAIKDVGIFNANIIDPIYVQSVLLHFCLSPEIVFPKDEQVTFRKIFNGRIKCTIPDSNFSDRNFLTESFVLEANTQVVQKVTKEIGSEKEKILNYSREEILREVFPKLKPFIMLPREISFDSFDVLDVPSDGNCTFWAVLIASGSVTSSDAPGASAAMEDLRNKSADLAVAANVDPDFVNLLRTPGQWNAGIHGGVGLEALHYIARHLGCRIILIEKEGDDFSYWNSGENNLVLYAIEARNIGKFLKDVKRNDKKAIFIYHEGNHFQAIVKK